MYIIEISDYHHIIRAENSTSRSGLATDDELDSIVNMLSGCMTCPCSSPSHSNPVTPISMLSMPDDHLQEASRTASLNSLRDYGVARTSVQLTVPVPHRLRSPASDSQVDEMRSPKLSRVSSFWFGVRFAFYMTSVHAQSVCWPYAVWLSIMVFAVLRFSLTLCCHG